MDTRALADHRPSRYGAATLAAGAGWQAEGQRQLEPEQREFQQYDDVGLGFHRETRLSVIPDEADFQNLWAEGCGLTIAESD